MAISANRLWQRVYVSEKDHRQTRGAVLVRASLIHLRIDDPPKDRKRPAMAIAFGLTGLKGLRPISSGYQCEKQLAALFSQLDSKVHSAVKTHS